MEVVNKKLVLVVIIMGIFCTFFIWQSISDKEAKLEMVSLNNETKSASMFAIMLEEIDEEGNSVYVESTDNMWPSSDEYLYNEIQSGCMDANGNKLVDALVYDTENKIASVETSNTSYCYLYFKIRPTAYGTILEGEENISVPIIGGMYRYQGIYDVVNNNYICFGTSDESECLSDTDKYMYRIIGITQDNQLKLIKKEALNNKISWYSDNSSNIKWPDSILYSSINGNKFLTNLSYIPSDWESKMENIDWKYGDIEKSTKGVSQNGLGVYETENNWDNIVNAKVGLMYLHDYYLAYDNISNFWLEGYTANWLYILNNDEFSPSIHEWTMSRWQFSDTISSGWAIVSTGGINSSWINNSDAVRPVFYTITLSVLNGEGTLESPFLIEW